MLPGSGHPVGGLGRVQVERVHFEDRAFSWVVWAEDQLQSFHPVICMVS